MKPETQINNYMRYFFKNCFLIYIILNFIVYFMQQNFAYVKSSN